MRTKLLGLVILISAMVACGTEGDRQQPMPEGPIARQVSALGAALGVPRDLVIAVAVVEGGLKLPARRVVRSDDIVPVAGILELRHGRFNSLAAGAALLRTTEDALRADTDLGTEAGVRVLADLAARKAVAGTDLASWSEVVRELSGLSDGFADDYVVRVYKTLRRGGLYPARDGELVYLAAHPEIPVALTMSPPGLQPMAPDFPGAVWAETPSDNKWTPGRPDGNDAVNIVVVHDTEGGWDASLSTLQWDGGKSAHYLIDADGSRVAQFLSESDTAWHAGNWCYNKHSIGIEHVGYASESSGFSTAEYDKSVELVNSIRSRWNVPVDRDHIVGHYQVPNGNVMDECSGPCSAGLDSCESDTSYGGAGHHTDPGYYWQWCQYMEKLGGTCNCNDAWSLWNCTTDKTEAWRCNNGQLEKQDCASCDVMPNGENDVCHAKEGPEPGPEAGPETEEASTPDDGSTPADAPSEAVADAPVPGDAGQADSGGKDGGASGAWSSSDDGGCGCRTSPQPGKFPAWLAFGLAGLVALSRKLSRRSRDCRREQRAGAGRSPS